MAAPLSLRPVVEARAAMTGRYEVILTTGDRAQADSPAAVLRAASQLVEDAAGTGRPSAQLRAGTLYTLDGRHISGRALESAGQSTPDPGKD